MFCLACSNWAQKLTFSGIGAHHQNGVAERNIKTISQWACAHMLHAAYHWHEQANIHLWPQAVDYAVWTFNRLPSMDTGLSPNEVWSQSQCTGHDLCHTHPFGCPLYVLDPKLRKMAAKYQNGIRKPAEECLLGFQRIIRPLYLCA